MKKSSTKSWLPAIGISFLVVLVGLLVSALLYLVLNDSKKTSEATEVFTIPQDFVLVKGGTFNMGGTAEQATALEWEDEMPVHQVTVSSFIMGKYEVTQQLWESAMGTNPSKTRGDLRPVELISWYDAIDFCNRLSEREGLQKAYSGFRGNIVCDFNSNGYRLPTEAEWEYAARGGNISKGYRYSGSNDLNSVGWFGATDNTGNRGKNERTSEVGRKQPNELGIFDMTGNVWEWCWDRKGDYTSENQTNPKGQNYGTDRVLRGGSWFVTEPGCRNANRNFNNPDNNTRNYVGLRLVRTK
jgi:formylglycine-generating enzyme required for sulfatase activity